MRQIRLRSDTIGIQSVRCTRPEDSCAVGSTSYTAGVQEQNIQVEARTDSAHCSTFHIHLHIIRNKQFSLKKQQLMMSLTVTVSCIKVCHFGVYKVIERANRICSQFMGECL